MLNSSPAYSLHDQFHFLAGQGEDTMNMLLLGCGTLALLVANLVGLGPTPAAALPAPQARCASTITAINSDDGFQPLSDLALTINNGDAARRALVQLSADMGVDDQSEV